MAHTKIATCCYCGARAALVLRGKERHELACSTCGAPLHEMKALKSKKQKQPFAVSHASRPVDVAKPRKLSKPRKKRKSFASRLFDEAWDVLEDIFD